MLIEEDSTIASDLEYCNFNYEYPAIENMQIYGLSTSNEDPSDAVFE
jgi:hypothetical protein